MSASPPKAEIAQDGCDVRFTPKKRTLDGLFNHVIGQLLQIQRDIEAERLRGLDVDPSSHLVGA